MGDAVACFTAARVQRLPICGEKTAIAWQPLFLASVFVLRLSWQIIIVFQMELKIIVDFSRLQGLMGIEGSGFSSASFFASIRRLLDRCSVLACSLKVPATTVTLGARRLTTDLLPRVAAP